MTDVYIVGVGMTPFGRQTHTSVKSLSERAITQALKDSGARHAVIGAAFFANATQSFMDGQHMIGGQVALRSMGLDRVPVYNVENACASASTAFQLACTHLAAGESEIALAVGVEKMYHADGSKEPSVFNGAWDVSSVPETVAALASLPQVAVPREFQLALDKQSLFMEIYASLARFHMQRYGTTQRQMAAVASKNHQHSTLNELSQYQHAVSIEEVLSARSVAWPLTLPMCSPISDGAAAAILCHKEALRYFDGARAVKVHACVVGGGADREPWDLSKHVSRLTALRAYEKAGFGPFEMSVAEVHDASSFAEILQSELLGFCAEGDGGPLAERGETTLGGRIPINPSGGLVSKGHPIGATGLAQIHELVVQLRHEAGARQVPNARLAIAENGGGFHRYEEAVAVVTILGS